MINAITFFNRLTALIEIYFIYCLFRCEIIFMPHMILYDIRYYILFYRIVYPVVLYTTDLKQCFAFTFSFNLQFDVGLLST